MLASGLHMAWSHMLFRTLIAGSLVAATGCPSDPLDEDDDGAATGSTSAGTTTGQTSLPPPTSETSTTSEDTTGTDGPGDTDTGSDTGDTGTTGGDLLPCVDEDLGDAIGTPVANATLSRQGNDFELACNGGGSSGTSASTGPWADEGGDDGGNDDGGSSASTTVATSASSDTGGGGFDPDAEDYVLQWTAPADGTYTFDLQGSSFDTVLALFEPSCSGRELACNDDCFGVQAALQYDMQAGQTVLIVIEGYGGQTGSFQLSIRNGDALECDYGPEPGTTFTTTN